MQRANRHMKNTKHCELSGKCKSQPQWDIISYLSKWLSSKTTQVRNIGKMWRKGNPRTLSVGMQIVAATVENSIEAVHKTLNRTSVCCAVLRHSVVSPNLWDPVDCGLPGSSVHGDSPGENTGVGCHAHSSELLYDPAIPLLGIYPLQKSHADSNRMGKSRDLFKKIRDTKGIFHAKMSTTKNRNKALDMTGQLNWMFMTALFTTAKKWTQPKRPPIDKSSKGGAYTMGYYFATKTTKFCYLQQHRWTWKALG